MASGRPVDVDEAVAAWRLVFGDVYAIRRDDVDEFCDHFREVIRFRVSAGDELSVAADAAAFQFGRPVDLVSEMRRARRSPRRSRWCMALAVYAVAQTAWIFVRVAGLALTVFRRNPSWDAYPPWILEMSVTSSVAGLAVIALMARRFGLLSGGRFRGRNRSALSAFLPIVLLGVALLFGSLFLDYWQWAVASAGASATPVWDTALPVLGALVVGPVMALTAATALAR